MKRSTTALFLPAIGISAALHVALVMFLPYRAAQPPLPPARELVPVNLVYRQAPVPASPVPVAKPLRTTQAPSSAQELPAPLPEPAPELLPVAQELAQEPTTVLPDAPVSAGSPAGEPESAAEGRAEAPAADPAVATRNAAASAAVAPGSEIAAYRAILSTLRGRIVEQIRYPPIARARGWKGTVVLSVHLDSAGRLEQILVRSSSGYEVIDRAAAALLRKVTPVSNPLSRPVTIEIPIAYELK